MSTLAALDLAVFSLALSAFALGLTIGVAMATSQEDAKQKQEPHAD